MTVPDLRELYDTHSKRVFNTVLSIVQNTGDAEEITQDVFLHIHRSIHKFKGESSITTWIYRIAVNHSVDFLRYKRRKKRWAIFVRDDTPPDVPDFHHPGVALEQKENAAILFKAIDRLPDSQKTAIVLSLVEELPQKEIAEIMRSSVGAVESLIQRAKSNLRKELENFYPDRRK
jgi:RNA polymerase sigma-70 factor (ECF subfamily)